MNRATRMTAAIVLSMALGGLAEARTGKNAVVVKMTDQMAFEPKAVQIKAGQTVVWKNTSTVMHTVTADPKLADDPNNVKLPPGAKPFDSGEIGPGGTFSHKFTVPGTYAYVCLPHGYGGMAGTVEVTR